MASSDYNELTTQYIDSESVTIPKEERCDNYYKLWKKIYRDVLKYWEFKDIKSIDELERLL